MHEGESEWRPGENDGVVFIRFVAFQIPFLNNLWLGLYFGGDALCFGTSNGKCRTEQMDSNGKAVDI